MSLPCLTYRRPTFQGCRLQNILFARSDLRPRSKTDRRCISSWLRSERACRAIELAKLMPNRFEARCTAPPAAIFTRVEPGLGRRAAGRATGIPVSFSAAEELGEKRSPSHAVYTIKQLAGSSLFAPDSLSPLPHASSPFNLSPP